MDRIAIYILLILIYLGVSKSFAPSQSGIPYVANSNVIGSLVNSSPVSVVLDDYYTAGFIIKTYYHRYRIIHAFRRPRILTVRTSYDFYQSNRSHLGMSLYRRSVAGKATQESVVPAPPGTLFLGNSSYGSWAYRNSGKKEWSFYRPYRSYIKLFRWGSFRPDQVYYQKLKLSLDQEKIFFGLNQEFGTAGTITKKYYPYFYQKKKKLNKFNWNKLLAKYSSLNSDWKNQ